MKSILFFSVLLAVFQVSQCILALNQHVPSSWGRNKRFGNYVKDDDDCKFGYRISPADNRVIHVLNCTFEDNEMFYVLKIHTCATASHVQNQETCDFTPIYMEDDKTVDPNDRDCAARSRGVAPDSKNCVQYKFCDDDRTRIGITSCPQGQYFSNVTMQCEFQWVDGINGEIRQLSEREMCGVRPMPVNSRTDYSSIMRKCLFNWNFQNADSYSVAERLNCNIRYLCSRFSLSIAYNSHILRCDPNMYWSDYYQRCSRAEDLLDTEIQECGLTVNR